MTTAGTPRKTQSRHPANPAPRAPAGRGARQRIIETALTLFYAEGVRAVGIDRIIAASGVAKMSFYRHFPSKTDLVCAFLEERHRRWMTWLATSFEARAARTLPRLPLVADILGEWFARHDFHGCAFINILAETTAADARERTIARLHKDELQAFLTSVAKSDGAPRPSETGRLALLIVEGAIVRAAMTGEARVASDCRKLLSALVTR